MSDPSASAVPPRPTRHDILRAIRLEYGPHRRGLWATSAIAGISAALEVAVVFVIAALGASVIGDAEGAPLGLGDALTARQLAIVAFVVVLIRGVADLIRARVEVRVSRSYELRSRLAINHAYVWAEWEYQTERNPGEMVGALNSYLSAGARILSTITKSTGLMVSFGVMLVGSFLAGGFWVFGILVGSGLLAALFRPLNHRAHEAGMRSKDAIKAYSGAFYHLVATALENRIFWAQEEVERRTAEPTRGVIDANAASRRVSAELGSLYGTVVYAVAVVGLGALAYAGSERAPAYAAVILLLYRGLGYAKSLQGSYQEVIGAFPNLAALQTERSALESAAFPHTGDTLKAPIQSIALDHVDFTYPSGVVALRDVSMSVQQGEAIGLVGPSGAGKSTIVQLLMRLRAPTRGRLLVNGQPAANISLRSWYEHVVLVPQTSYLFLGTLIENVTCFRPWVSEEDAIEAMRRAAVYDEFAAFPDGLSTRVGGEWGHRLSGGQRQRLMIARALASRPDLLIMDEPTSSLDLPTEEFIRQTLDALKGTVTLIIIAHRFSTLRICDRVIVLKDGAVEASGSRTELEADNTFYSEAVRLARLV